MKRFLANRIPKQFVPVTARTESVSVAALKVDKEKERKRKSRSGKFVDCVFFKYVVFF